jgi:hypothetical protein
MAAARLAVVRERGEAFSPARTYVCYAAAGASECLLRELPPIGLAVGHAIVVERDIAAGGLSVNPTCAQSVALVAVIH